MFLLEINCLASAVGIALCTDCEPIGDTPAVYAFIDPVPRRCFEDVEILTIHYQVSIVIIKIVIKTAVPTLTVFFKKVDDHIAGFLCG